MKEQTARYSSNRSESGASVQAILMSIIRTLEMKGVDSLGYLGVTLPMRFMPKT